MPTTTKQRPPPEGGGIDTQPRRPVDAPARARALGSAAPKANRPPALARPSRRFLFGLLGLLVVYITMSLALSAVAPTVGFGWTSVVITSGSMSPSFSIGDVVVASPHDGRELAPGDIVVFSDPARPGLLTHRIESTNPDGSYVTRGDANRQPDSTPLRPEQVVGVGSFVVPLIGLPLVWYWSGAWAELAVWAAGMLLALWLARYALLERYPRAQLEDSGHMGTPPTAPETVLDRRLRTLPVVRNLPRDLVVDVPATNGSDPKERITRDDVPTASKPVSPSKSETTVSSPSEVLVEVPTRRASAEVVAEEGAPSSQPDVDERRHLSPLVGAAAANTATSGVEIPHVTTVDEVDASRLLKVHQALARRHDSKISLDALVVMAVIPVLRSFPEFYANIDGDEPTVHGASDIGIAVETPDGLLVPVIVDAAAKGVIEPTAEVRRPGEGAKSRSLSPVELTGYPLSVSNVGTVNGSHGTPIIPPGTTAILSVGRAQQKPIVIDDELVITPVMPLSLSYDHRVIDEGLGRRFMAQVIENLEEPALFLAS